MISIRAFVLVVPLAFVFSACIGDTSDIFGNTRSPNDPYEPPSIPRSLSDGFLCMTDDECSSGLCDNMGNLECSSVECFDARDRCWGDDSDCALSGHRFYFACDPSRTSRTYVCGSHKTPKNEHDCTQAFAIETSDLGGEMSNDRIIGFCCVIGP